MSKIIRIENCEKCADSIGRGFLSQLKMCGKLWEIHGYTKVFEIPEPKKILANCPLEDYPEKKRFEDWYYTPGSIELVKSDEILPVKFAKLWRIAQGES